MRPPVALRAQRGATLVIGLIMLVLITLMMTSAFMLSSGNLRAVGNMQFRSEAMAAANLAIEQVLGTDFSEAPAAQTVNIDLDNDGTTDYAVEVAIPTCVRATVAKPALGSSLSLGTAMSSSAFWNTVWDIDADVNDTATGAAIRIHQGVRVLLSKAQKDSVCDD
jgi:hypothetical protein